MTETPNPAETPTAETPTEETPTAGPAPADPPPPYPGQAPVLPVKRLYRDPNGAIGGVMSGLAHYFEVDVTLARLAMVVFVLLTGMGVLAYIVAWIIVPVAPHPLYAGQPVQPPVYGTATQPGSGLSV